MIVIQSGFSSIREVALAQNVVAVRNAERTGDRFGWDVELWPLLPEGQPQRFTPVAFNPFGFEFDLRTGSLLFGECDGFPPSINGVKRADGAVIAAPVDGAGITGFALSPDGERMICLESWRDMTVYETPPPERRFVLCTRTSDGGWVRQQTVRRSDEFLERLAFLPDGERFVAVGQEARTNSRRTHTFHEPTLRVFDARTFAFLETVEAWEPQFCGHWMVTNFSTGLLFRDTRDFSRTPVCVRKGRRKFAAIAADPAGQFFLTASGHRVSVWETKTWNEVKTFDWKAGAVTCLAVAPDGLTAAAGTATGKVVVWDME